MRIYEIGTGYTPIPAQISAATEIVVEELTRAFLKQNVPVEIIDIASRDRKENDLPIRDVKVPKMFSGTDVQLGIMHKLKRVVYSIALAKELTKILKKSREKVVLHFHNQYNMFFFLKLVPEKIRKKAILAYTNHSGIWRLKWEDISLTVRKRYFQEAECMKKADAVFVLNSETRYNVIKNLGVPEDRVNLIRNGVNTDVYYPLDEKEKHKAKKKWKMDEKRVILQVGSVCENKGQLRSIEYLMPVIKAHHDVVFAYAGGIIDVEFKNKIDVFVKEHNITDNVYYFGMLPPGKELNEVYNIAEATICSSGYESFSLVSVESLASGTPTLINDISPIDFGEGCIRYKYSDDGKTVFTEVLSLDKSYKEKCRNARINALGNLGWTKIANDYLMIWNKENDRAEQ